MCVFLFYFYCGAEIFISLFCETSRPWTSPNVGLDLLLFGSVTPILLNFSHSWQCPIPVGPCAAGSPSSQLHIFTGNRRFQPVQSFTTDLLHFPALDMAKPLQAPAAFLQRPSLCFWVNASCSMGGFCFSQVWQAPVLAASFLPQGQPCAGLVAFGAVSSPAFVLEFERIPC